MLSVYAKKHSSHVAQSIQKQPKQNLVVCEAACSLFWSQGEEKHISCKNLYKHVMCEVAK
jgi:hypothetical protein